jgi:hypothetical protein
LAALVAAYVVLALAVDARYGDSAELPLTTATWVLLALVLWGRSDIWRVRAIVVVAVATAGELVGSQLLGIYTYRDGAVPGFVPPGHGLVFLAGCGLAQARWVRARGDHFAAAACGVALAWALAGATRLEAPDLAGALGAALFVALMIAAPRWLRPYYAGVFIAVSLLEIYGTAVGTWQWAATTPLLGLPAGNPPSGVASGYVLFDLAAFTCAPALLAWASRGPRRTSASPAGTT